VSEFTGERVIPGQVEEDLWAEHIARYAFAGRFARYGRVLDLGCGTGYGTAELSKRATEAIGVDVAADAIEYAKAHYRSAHYVQVSAVDTPFSDHSFDLATCFELIEHLADYRPLLAEAKRVLHPTGLFMVSTPNKLYYAESRGEAGPNPFHEHEFECEEFQQALLEYFPHVKLLLQDRMESFSIYPAGASGEAESEIVHATRDATAANFFIAVCSQEPLPEFKPFVYVPRAVNLLRERELHVTKLEQELAQVRTWLAETTAERDDLLKRQTTIEEENDRKTAWAKDLALQLTKVEERVAELQQNAESQRAEAATIIRGLNEENAKNGKWALELDKQLAASEAELTKANAKLDALRVKMEGVRQSRWHKAGRHLGLGPKVD
jgi:ubiquinone/menaquinone biosynthesis C-methylase UbiE